MGVAAQFMRDNTSGGLVAKSVRQKDGSVKYTMEEGHSYLLKASDLETLSRYNFKPRFHPFVQMEGSDG